MFSCRRISVYQNDVNELAITKNQTVMDLAVQYAQQHNLKPNELQDINFIRKLKRVFLPIELVGESRRFQMQCYSDISTSSQIEWKFLPQIQGQSTRKQQQRWIQFMRWLILQNYPTQMEFIPKRWKWKITKDRKYLRIEEDQKENETNEVVWYELINKQNNEHRRIEQSPTINKQSMVGIIGRLS